MQAFVPCWLILCVKGYTRSPSIKGEGKVAKFEQEGTMTNSSRSGQGEPRTSTLPYSWGEVRITVDVKGPVEDSEAMRDDMMSAAISVTGLEIIHSGFSNLSDAREPRPEPFKLSLEVGDGIVAYTEINVVPKQDVIPRRPLNDIVINSILLTTLQAAGTHLSQRRQDYTASQESLSPTELNFARRTASQLLGVTPVQPTLFDSIDELERTGRGQKKLVHS